MKKIKKIGYTTGVFDLFHVGHLNILKKASENCDYLIVGVTSCETVLKYKGRLPIVPLEERLKIVEAIKYVDEIFIQEEMDKVKAWEKLKFDVLFHGDDWKNSKMYENIENKLKSRGVEIKYFEYTKGTSTSELKTRIYDRYKIENP